MDATFLPPPDLKTGREKTKQGSGAKKQSWKVMTLKNPIKMAVLTIASMPLLFWTVSAQAVEQDQDDRSPLACPEDEE